MTTAFPVIPPDTRAAGQSGHVGDHNAISDGLSALEAAVTALQATGFTVPVPVQASAYSAQPGQLIPVSTVSGAVTVTLPPAPAGGTQIAVVLTAGTHALTIAAGGSDVLNAPGGPVTLSLTVVGQGVLLEYSGTVLPAAGTWYQIADAGSSGASLPMTTLGDTIYQGSSAPARLAGNTTVTPEFYTQTGTGTQSAAPAWRTIQQSDLAPVGSPAPAKYAPLLYGAIWGYPWKFYPESRGAKGDARIIGDATVTGGALTTLTSASGPFKSGDTGKIIMLNGGQGNNAQPLICPITYVNAGTVTLGTAASGALANASAVYATDDTAAINNCLTDLANYAMAPGGPYEAEFLLSAMYGVASLPGITSGIAGSTTSQLPLPSPAASGVTQKLIINILGIGSADANMYWESTVPSVQGAALISMCIPPFTSGTNPFPSVLGYQYADTGTLTGGFANTKAYVDGVTIVIPFLGPQGAYDFRFLGGAGGGRFSAMSFGAPANGNYNNLSSLNGLSGQQNGSSVGLFMPLTGNNDDCTVISFTNQGFTFGINLTEHCSFLRSASIYDIVGIQCVGGGAHVGASVNYASVEQAFAALQYTGTSPFPFYGILDCEQISTWHVQDTQQSLYGRVYVHTNSGSAPSVQGGSNAEIIWDAQGRTVQGAPGYTLGTTFQNPWWRHSTLTLAGGTVTGISIGPTSGSLTSLGITSGTFRLPSGWWLNIAGSVKPATFIGVLD